MIQNFVSQHTGAGVARDLAFLVSTSPQHMPSASVNIVNNNILCELNNQVITADTHLFAYAQFTDPAQFSQYCFTAAASIASIGTIMAPVIFRASCPKGASVTPANFWATMDVCHTYAIRSESIFGGLSAKDAVSFNPFETDTSEDIDVYWGVLIWVSVSGTGPFGLNGTVEGHCVTVDNPVYQPNK